jgi:hypothetical protein
VPIVETFLHFLTSPAILDFIDRHIIEQNTLEIHSRDIGKVPRAGFAGIESRFYVYILCILLHYSSNSGERSRCKIAELQITPCRMCIQRAKLYHMRSDEAESNNANAGLRIPKSTSTEDKRINWRYKDN